MRAAGLLALAASSGFAGLGYEVVWTRMLALQLGHDITAALSVITAFFAGLALGGVTLGVRAGCSLRPDRWYAGLEFGIGVWAVALAVLLPAVGLVTPSLLGTDPAPALQWSVALLLPLLVLLPATVAMGATLPALVAILSRHGRGAVGSVYAVNTAGAVVGTMLSTFVLAPALGFTATLWLLAAVNVLCGAGALWLGPGSVAPVSSAIRQTPELGDGRRLTTLAAAGLLGVGYQVLTIRVLGQLLENTVFTFACLLSVFLLGTAAGGAVQRRLPGTLDQLLAGTALACLAGTAVLFGADLLLDQLRTVLPRSPAGGIAAELLLGAAALLLPSAGMGALFSHLGQASMQRPGGLGWAAGANTAGAALAPVVFGVLVLPGLGAKAGLAAVALGYAALIRLQGWRWTVVPALLGVTVLAAPVRLSFVRVPPGGTIVAEVEGVTAAVAVVQDRAGDRVLQVNSHFRQGGTATVRTDRRLAYLPLLLHPAPRRALFLGLGTGVTLAAALDQPGLRADGVELVPEILPLLPYFSRAAGDLQAQPGVRLHMADARRFVRAAPDRYDVVMADLYYPAVDGAGALYTREHFEAIRARLTEGGVFCQWLPLHQMDFGTLRLITRTFLDAFPDGSAWMANFSLETPLIALIGTAGPARYQPGWYEQRTSGTAFRDAVRANGLTGDLSLFGLFLADSAGLARFAGPGPLNTDNRPLVTWTAPAAAYAATDTSASRLVQLVGLLDPPGTVLAGDTAALAAYRQARNAFLRLGADEAARGARPESTAGLINRMAPALLQIMHLSPAFDPAYDPLLAMARALHQSNPAFAVRLLQDLDAAAPSRPDARRLLQSLIPAGAAAR